MMDKPAYRVVSARAAYDDGFLVIFAVSDITATNYEPYIKRSPILIFPPPLQFYAVESQTAPVGGDIIVPKPVAQVFPQPGPKPNAITISASTNSLDVPVEDIDPMAPSSQVLLGVFKRGQEGSAFQLASGGGEIPSAHKNATTFRDVATGYSNSMSFEEAFEDAVRQLPAIPFPDALMSIRVTGIGAEIGGIAGIRRLWVSISRIWLKGVAAEP
jgi:hypothetical protein